MCRLGQALCPPVFGGLPALLLLLLAWGPLSRSLGAAEDPPAAAGRLIEIPARLPDGRAVRGIGLYQSQLDELIPGHFRPVDRSRLLRGLQRLSRLADDGVTARVGSAVFWVDVQRDLLISDRSELEIEWDSKSREPVAVSLGRVNLAIVSDPNPLQGTQLPRLENAADGTLFAVADAGSGAESIVRFKWQLRGQAIGAGHQFDLQLPLSPQTRIVISAPQETTVEALDGVLRARSGPPPDAGTFVTSQPLRWYELDAGGLARVRIRTGPQQSPQSFPLIVRDTRARYRADATGLRWNCSVQVQTPAGAVLPDFQHGGGHVTGVLVNSFAVPFTTAQRGSRQQVTIVAPERAFPEDQELTTIAITGFTPLRSTSGWYPLTLPDWLGEVDYASTSNQVELVVPHSMQLADWELPTDWRRQPRRVVDDEQAIYSAVGPPPALASPVESGEPMTPGGQPSSWSRIQLMERAVMNIAQTSLRVTVNDQTLSAQARMTIQADSLLLAPLRLAIQEDWSVESVSLLSEGRVIENPRLSAAARMLQIWPAVNELERGQLTLEIRGSRSIEADETVRRIPATWFVAPDNIAHELTASITSPPELSWSSDALVQPHQIDVAQLAESERRFLEPAAGATLLFQPPFGHTPALALDVPLASFDARSKLFVRRDGDQWIEQLEIEIESSGRRLDEVQIQAGPSHDRPPFRWFITPESGPSESLSSMSALPVDFAAEDGSYTIRLDHPSPRTRRVIARRAYRAGATQQVHLPTIPGATSQQYELWLSADLQVAQTGDELQAILPRQAETPVGTAPPARSRDILVDARPPDLAKYFGYRYASGQAAEVTIADKPQDIDVAIVHRASMRVIASSRGSDRVEVTYDLAPAKVPLQIHFEPGLRWVRSESEPYAASVCTATDNRLTIAAHADRQTVRAIWDRDRQTRSWLRRCQVPTIATSGVVLRADYELVPAEDTFAPSAIWRGGSLEDERLSSIPLGPGESVWLFRRNVVFALGWLVALLVFSFSWYLAFRRLGWLVCLVVVSVAAAFLWWPWRLALCGWLVVPMIAAGLLGTSRRRSAPKEPGPESKLMDQTRRSATPRDWSVSTLLRLLPWWICIGSWVGASRPAPVTGQDSAAVVAAGPSAGAESTPSADPKVAGGAIEVLIPVDQDGQQAGETVYVADSVLRQVLPAAEHAVPQAASIQRAHYRVRLDDAEFQQGNLGVPVIEAEYLLWVPAATDSINAVRLPLAAATVRRIELLGAADRMVQFDSDSPASVVALLPAEKRFNLRVTLVPSLSQQHGWNRMELPIPVVSASAVTIESNENLDALRVGGESGRLLPTETGRRWQYQLGPQPVLLLDYRTPQPPAELSRDPLLRRYVVDVGRRNTSIECQLQPPGPLVEGDRFKFILRDQMQPRIVSRDWELDSTTVTAATRREITVRSTRDRPGAIRLLWTRPIAWSSADRLEAPTVQIPEVVAAGSLATAPAWIALRSDPAVRFGPLNGDGFEPLSVDQFLAAWQGYQADLQGAYVSVAGIPDLAIELSPAPITRADQQHHIHLTGDRIEMEYQATLGPPVDATTQQRLLLPDSLAIERIWINDQAQPFRTTRIDGGHAVPLPLVESTEPIEIRARGTQVVDPATPFSLPRVRLEAATINSDRYLVSREPAVDFPLAENIASASEPLPSELAQQWLRQRRSPVGFWLTGNESLAGGSLRRSESLPQPSGSVTLLEPEFDCQQLVSIRAQDDRWILETLIALDSQTAPDVIDVEVPTKWTEDLEVEGALQWIALPINHAGPGQDERIIIRVRYDRETVAKRPLTVRSTLTAGDTSRLTVPTVRTLGSGKRRIYVDVPTHTPAGEPIQWSTTAVESTQLAAEWTSIRGSQRDRATFVAARPAWSIELAALPERDAAPQAYHADLRIFPGEAFATVHARWDLAPGDLERIQVRVPAAARVLAAWHAGQPRPVERGLEGDGDRIAIPLAIGELPGVLELLLAVPVADVERGGYLPQLVDVPVARSWLVQSATEWPRAPLAATSAGGHQELTLPPPAQRQAWHQCLLSRARSALESIDATERVSGRPQPEIVSAIGRWLARYHSLRSHASQRVDGPTFPKAWGELDEQSQRIAVRYGIDPGSLREPETPSVDLESLGLSPLGQTDPAESIVARVVPLTRGVDPPPLKNQPWSDRGLFQLLVNGLTLAAVVGVLICLLPIRDYIAPVLRHPAAWLTAMGLIGFVVAPPAVAGSLILVAGVLFVFPSSRRRYTGFGQGW